MTLDEEDRKFLESQREKGRRGYIGSVHKDWTQNTWKNRWRDTTNWNRISLLGSSTESSSTDDSGNEVKSGHSIASKEQFKMTKKDQTLWRDAHSLLWCTALQNGLLF